MKAAGFIYLLHSWITLKNEIKSVLFGAIFRKIHDYYCNYYVKEINVHSVNVTLYSSHVYQLRGAGQQKGYPVLMDNPGSLLTMDDSLIWISRELSLPENASYSFSWKSETRQAKHIYSSLLNVSIFLQFLVIKIYI